MRAIRAITRPGKRLAGCSMAEYVENQGRLLAYLLDLADEARELLETVGSRQ